MANTKTASKKKAKTIDSNINPETGKRYYNYSKRKKKNAKSIKAAVLKKGITITAAREQAFSSDPNNMFEIKEGLPTNLRMQLDPEMYERIKNTLGALNPKNKQHFVLGIKLRDKVKHIVKREFPEYDVRTAANPDKKTISVWRVK